MANLVKRAALVVAMAGSCTKTLEQPVAAPVPAAPDPSLAPVAKKIVARKPSTFGGWPAPAEPRPAAAAATPSGPKAPDGGWGTLNGNPRGLRREELTQAVDVMMAAASGCFPTGTNGSVGVHFDADPSGKARNLSITGADPVDTACLSALVLATKLPSFEGPAVPVDAPLNVQKTLTQIPGSPAAPAAPPASLPVGLPSTAPNKPSGQNGLFVNP